MGAIGYGDLRIEMTGPALAGWSSSVGRPAPGRPAAQLVSPTRHFTRRLELSVGRGRMEACPEGLQPRPARPPQPVARAR
jgi:hypothetical protein